MSYFLSRLPEEMHSLPSENETRNLEWLASRYILSLLVPEARISKGTGIKPILLDDIRYISISHTQSYAACIVSNMP